MCAIVNLTGMKSEDKLDLTCEVKLDLTWTVADVWRYISAWIIGVSNVH